MDKMGTLGNEGPRGRWDCPDHQELLDHRVIEVLSVSQECRDQQGPKDNKEKRELQESRAEMETMASRDFRELRA